MKTGHDKEVADFERTRAHVLLEAVRLTNLLDREDLTPARREGLEAKRAVRQIEYEHLDRLLALVRHGVEERRKVRFDTYTGPEVIRGEDGACSVFYRGRVLPGAGNDDHILYVIDPGLVERLRREHQPFERAQVQQAMARMLPAVLGGGRPVRTPGRSQGLLLEVQFDRCLTTGGRRGIRRLLQASQVTTLSACPLEPPEPPPPGPSEPPEPYPTRYLEIVVTHTRPKR